LSLGMKTPLPFVVEIGQLAERGQSVYSVSAESGEAVVMTFPLSRVVGVYVAEDTLYSLCLSERTTRIGCNGDLWVVPQTDTGGQKAVRITGPGEKVAERTGEGIRVTLPGSEQTLTLYPDRPACDVMGNHISLNFAGGDNFEKTLSHFYWDTLVPSVIEKTDALGYPVSSGYVVSTLQPGEYAGTYPDVDHEFQNKGRLAIHSASDIATVEHMMSLQFRLMREDPTGLWRNPCAIQPNGNREYHVRRNSFDNTQNAEMFLITGNVEILETAWLYFAATKDLEWLRAHIEDLEGAASLLEHLTDRNGKLWSDVFYEDQVIKDGMEGMSAAMAANGLERLAELEALLGRHPQQIRWHNLAETIGRTMSLTVPHGFWDGANARYVDWIDRSGVVHDHIHLLANCLPVLFGYASDTQAKAVEALIKENFAELQRFPTFLSPRIADYTESEIGNSPYDLCAAGRYWCWDAAYWAFKQRGDILLGQLRQVAEQARIDNYRMGERYDMNHVYYIDDKNWHGAPYYYEYPNVFAWVLIHDYLGLRPALDVDLELCPLLTQYGQVRLEAYGIGYNYEAERFALENLSGKGKTVRLFLEALYPGQSLLLEGEPLGKGAEVRLGPGQTIVVVVSKKE